MSERITDWVKRDVPSSIAKQMSPRLPAAIAYAREEEVMLHSLWPAVPPVSPIKPLASADIVMDMRLKFAAQELKGAVEIDPARVDGVPVIVGTRIAAGRILAEMADGWSLTRVSREYDIEKEKIALLLRGLAAYLEKPLSRSERAPLRPGWVVRLEELGTGRPSTAALAALVDTIFDLMSEQSFDELDRALRTLEVARVSADALVAMLRLTFSARMKIASWNTLLEKARAELDSRGVNTKLELVGLEGGLDAEQSA